MPSLSGSSFNSGRGPVALGPPWVTILLLSSSTRAFCSALFNPYNKEATLKPLSYNSSRQLQIGVYIHTAQVAQYHGNVM